ncbi:hypothetical protein [Arthrobacter sp. D2-10]
MTTQPARRTLGGLAPKAGKAAGVNRLIRANRPTAEQDSQSIPSPVAVVPPAELTEQDTRPPQRLDDDTAQERRNSSIATDRETDSGTNRVPKYLQLLRREARIHHEQAEALTALSRRLNNQRRLPNGTTTGERITDNTLIRIAIDLLLEREYEIRGTTEEEIAQLLGLRRASN